MSRLSLKFALSSLLAVALVCVAVAAELRIVALADLHGNLPALPTLATTVKELPEPKLVVDVGDLSQGRFEADCSPSAPMIRFLNLLDCEFLVPGNHDFEVSPEVFAERYRRFNGKILGADWRFAGVNPLPWAMVERCGVKIAFIGLTDPAMPTRVLPAERSAFTDQEEALRQIMPRVRAAKPDLVVLLRHSGRFGKYNLVHLIRRYPEIKIVFGAHTHEETPFERVGNAVYLQPGCRGNAVAVATLLIDDKTKKVVDINCELRRPATTPAPMVSALVSDTKREMKKISWAKVGAWRAPFGDFVADACRESVQADAALVPPFRFAPEKSELNHWELYRVLPYGNTLCVLELNRNELAVLLVNAGRYWKKNAKNMGMSGVSVRFDNRGRLINFTAPSGVFKLVAPDYFFTIAGKFAPELLARVKRVPILERDAVAAKMAK